MPNSISWLVVTDLDKTRIFSFKKTSRQLNFVTTIQNESHTTEDNLRQKGASVKSATDGQRALTNEASFKRRFTERYIHEVIDVLSIGRKEGAYQHLYIAAGPESMGLIRGHLDKETQYLIRQEFTKDYARFSKEDIFELLKEDLLAPEVHLSA